MGNTTKAYDPVTFASLVHGAWTLQERMSVATKSWKRIDASLDDPGNLLQTWREALCPDGLQEPFVRRLTWSDWDRDTAARVLSEADRFDCDTERKAIPPWADALCDIMHSTERYFCDGKEAIPNCVPTIEFSSPLEVAEPLPFEDLMMPAVLYARRQLHEQLAEVRTALFDRVALTSFRDLERALLVELTQITSGVLFTEFAKTRTYGSNLLLRLNCIKPDANQRELYDQFVRRHGENGLGEIFSTYPFLARLVATRVILWIDATCEFLKRLLADWQRLQNFIAGETIWPLRRVVHLRSGLGDSHHGGRTVQLVEFDDGAKVVYKPRNLGIDKGLVDFFTWCHDAMQLNLHCPNVVCGAGYGWAEFIEAKPLSSSRNADQFYHRAGQLLCVLYVLGGSDCHFENVISHDGELTLIDVETLLHSRLKEERDETDDDSAVDMTRRVWDSVLRVGLLPSWSFMGAQRVPIDLSGLASEADSDSMKWRWSWQAVNSDDMQRHVVDGGSIPQQNIPTFDGTTLNSSDYIGSLIEGFEKAYRAILSQKDCLLAADGPLRVFEGLATRYVFRPTNVYGRILNRCLSPDTLSSGIAWGLKLELLARGFTIMERRPQCWPILASEIAQLQQLDVPYFSAETDSCSLVIPDGAPLPNVMESASLGRAKKRIDDLSMEDMRFQVEIIRGAYAARAANAVVDRERVPVDSHDSTDSSVVYGEFVEEARRIAKDIEARVLRDGVGASRWVGFSYVPEANRVQLNVVGNGLYDGQTGIALFLAALDYVEQNDRYRSLWKQAMEPLRELRRRPDLHRRYCARTGIGLAAGAGGALYAMIQLSDLAPTESDWLLSTASWFAEQLTPKHVEADTVLDLIGGGAGAILGLLSLYEKSHDDGHLKRALWCGRHVAQRHRQKLARPSLKPIPLTGFSHGASGIAYALLRLFRATGEADLHDAAQAALQYEADLYDNQQRNWPDLRPGQSSKSFMVSWCHGAPGIALARLGMMSIAPTPATRAQCEMALKTTVDTSAQHIDHLCCGEFGLVDVLMTAGIRLQRPELRELAEQRASRVVQRAARNGAYRLFADLAEPVLNPGFFQGTAGIGYQLLRLAYPDLLPSVLLFETRHDTGEYYTCVDSMA